MSNNKWARMFAKRNFVRTRVCVYFSVAGTCKFGEDCRYRHAPASPSVLDVPGQSAKFEEWTVFQETMLKMVAIMKKIWE